MLASRNMASAATIVRTQIFTGFRRPGSGWTGRGLTSTTGAGWGAIVTGGSTAATTVCWPTRGWVCAPWPTGAATTTGPDVSALAPALTIGASAWATSAGF